MISLKRSNSVQGSSVSEASDDPYGHGTVIFLEADQVAALGLADIEANSPVSVEAKGFVKSVTINKDKDGDKVTVAIQLTDMGVRPGNRLSEAARQLYGGAQDGADASQSGMGA